MSLMAVINHHCTKYKFHRRRGGRRINDFTLVHFTFIYICIYFLAVLLFLYNHMFVNVDRIENWLMPNMLSTINKDVIIIIIIIMIIWHFTQW